MDSYLTLGKSAEAQLVERRSKFIATARPVENADEALAFIEQIRRTYKDATHNVWAYRINSGDMRASDDGEPSGTAGAPVLQVLCRRELCKAALVVTRYFGGVLLGAGGLIRAYSAAAVLAADAAQTVLMSLCDCLEITADYSDAGRIRNALDAAPVTVTDCRYGAAAVFSLYTRKENTAALISQINELCSARAAVSTVSEGFHPTQTLQ